MIIRKLFYGLFILLFSSITFKTVARELPKVRKTQQTTRTAEACLPSSSSITLDVNNVRTLIHNGGDMWWDLVGAPRYEIPKVEDLASKRHSSFAASLWIGGIDATGQLRVAAQTYRQDGNDFWPGPLDLTGGTTEKAYCSKWNKHYKITREEVDAFRAEYARVGAGIDMSKYPNVRDWPGNNYDAGFELKLAPFKDINQDMRYSPTDGDYPKIKGDQAIWWVINDKGDIHTATGGQQIGIEIQMMAFAFSATNAINNMTFYSQKVVNRSPITLNQTYIAQWADIDLGFYNDDYVGCDTLRGLGFAYNGDADDNANSGGYGLNPPAIGVDFFQGPIADPNDGIDNDKDGLIDELDINGIDDDDDGLIDEDDEIYERWAMSKFVYYNNDFTLTGNPQTAGHYYGYMTGFWKDGSPIVKDYSQGYSPGGSYPRTNYMFPTYPGSACSYAAPATGDVWTEKTAGNPPADRRLLQSAGPFTLRPGAVNEIVTGVVWARKYVDDQFGSLCELLSADDVAQALFDAKFQLVDGPTSPDLAIEEFDRELVLSWDNSVSSNNYNETYAGVDPVLSKIFQGNIERATFRFQGYLLFQLASENVSAQELYDSDHARLLLQCDIKDGVSTIVNRSMTTLSGVSEPIIVDQTMVNGANKGIIHSISVKEDLFAEGSVKQLVNYRPYYYGIIAYAYNDTSSDGRKFLQGRLGFKAMKAVPHKIEFENYGTHLNAQYGTGVNISRTNGYGTGGNYLEFTPETINDIVTNGFATNTIYKGGFAPVSVKVVNPKEVKKKQYRLEITRDALLRTTISSTGDTTWYYADWVLYEKNGSNLDTVFVSTYTKNSVSRVAIPEPLNGTEKLIKDKQGNSHGIAIAIKDAQNPGTNPLDPLNGFVDSKITFSNSAKQWLTGLPDVDGFPAFNWIRSGGCPRDGDNKEELWDYCINTGINYKNYCSYDEQQAFEKVLQGTWAPYILTRGLVYGNGSAFDGSNVCPRIGFQENSNNIFASVRNAVTLCKLPNVDVVITTDKTKWSRCIVVETSPSKELGSGAPIMAAKYRTSLDIDGKPITPAGRRDDYGYSYFPGYAYNVDTGERLNLFFGESSWNRADNGDDMLFNPSAGFGSDGSAPGGRHYLYVTNQRYDGCADYAKDLCVGTASLPTGVTNGVVVYNYPNMGDTARFENVYRHVAWASVPLVSASSYEYKSYNQIPADVKISLRVNHQFETMAGTNPTYDFDLNSYAAEANVNDVAKKAVTDLIKVVPNPFYGRSGSGQGRYETSQLDNRCKITNLPFKCKIQIFTLSGTLVRTFNKEAEDPALEWDFKNKDGVTVASGVYIIYVDAGDLGTKVLKLFAILPELDLQSY